MPAGSPAATAAASADPPLRAPVATATPLPPPSAAARAEAAPVSVNLLDAVDQDAQAASLENAAADGLPFCEVCAKAARARAAA